MKTPATEYLPVPDVVTVPKKPAAPALSITEILTARKFDAAHQPPDAQPVYSLAGTTIATWGNLGAITAAIKAGKSATVGAMLAAPMAKSPGDFLGFASANPNGFALLHFDTEQSPDDFWHLISRSAKRAGLNTPPPWLHSYCLTGMPHRQQMECIKAAIQIAKDTIGKIHSIHLDGIADLVADVNDAGETNAFVAEWHGIAIENDCPVIGVIHFNPGSEKTRGHLGSQWERKAETNLRLDKEGDITTIWSNKQRRAPIPKGTGPCFAWSEAAGMHVSIESLQSAANKEKVETLALLRDELFRKRAAMNYTDLTKLLTAKKGLAVSERTAARKISEMSKLGLIEKSVAGLWIKGKS